MKFSKRLCDEPIPSIAKLSYPQGAQRVILYPHLLALWVDIEINIPKNNTVNTTETIHRELYYQAFRAVRDYHTPFGTSSKTIKDKKGTVKSYKLTFTLTQSLSGKDDVKDYLEKSFPHGEKGKIVVSVEEPAIFLSKTSNNSLTVTMKYEMTKSIWHGLQLLISLSFIFIKLIWIWACGANRLQ